MSRVPTLAEVVSAGIEAKLIDLMTCTVGRIKEYDPIQQVADIVPVIMRPINAHGAPDHEELPVLPNVPLVWPRAGGFSMHMPVQAGDHVLVLFMQNDISQWRETGSVSEPDDLRRHSLGSAVALVGLAPMTEPLTDLPNVGMDQNEAVFKGGVFRFGSKTAAVPVALAPLVQVFIDLFNLHTHGTGVGPTTVPVTQHLAPIASSNVKAEP